MKHLATTILGICMGVSLMAAGDGSAADSLSRRGVAFDWDVSLDYLFDNSEYSRSDDSYDASGTLHGVRLSPRVGLAIPQGDSTLHRIRIGVDLQKLAGENLPVSDVFNEVQLYYEVTANPGAGKWFEALAGCFPRREFADSYTGPIFDRSIPFRDANADGVLFKYWDRSIRAELGLDWLGMMGDAKHPERRERFQVLTSGDWTFAGHFHLLWTGLFYHYACSLVKTGVVDNHRIVPMLEWRPAYRLWNLSLSAGAILTYQYDRKYDDRPSAPAGFYSLQEAGAWGVRLTNRFYCGPDLDILYDKYGNELYPGSRMFGTKLSGVSISDEVELSYCRDITDWLDIGVYAIFSFGSPNPSLGTGAYRGCRQFVSLKADIERFGDGFRAVRGNTNRR